MTHKHIINSLLSEEIIKKLEAQHTYDSFLELCDELSILSHFSPHDTTKLKQLITSFISTLNKATGSLRAPQHISSSFAFPDILSQIQKYLTSYGGHALAAGFSLPYEQLHAFISAFTAYIHSQTYSYVNNHGNVITIPPEHITQTCMDDIFSLSPFGIDFPMPLLHTTYSHEHTVHILPHKTQFDLCHLKINGDVVCMVFSQPQEHVKPYVIDSHIITGVTLEVYAKPSQNVFRSQTSYQLIAESVTWIDHRNT